MYPCDGLPVHSPRKNPASTIVSVLCCTVQHALQFMYDHDGSNISRFAVYLKHIYIIDVTCSSQIRRAGDTLGATKTLALAADPRYCPRAGGKRCILQKGVGTFFFGKERILEFRIDLTAVTLAIGRVASLRSTRHGPDANCPPGS
jgi:hypothetical protein